ncbi:MAG TPA: tyrosinase family protein [Thermomicrobiales bacterium]|jgi:tyrosinase
MGGNGAPAPATPAPGEPPSPETSTTILGTMAATSSPSDPVFWLRHANIDRLWNQWVSRYGQTSLPTDGGPFGSNLNDPM